MGAAKAIDMNHDGRRGDMTDASEEMVASSAGVLGTNRGHTTKGMQAYYTDAATSKWIASILNADAVVLDPTCGNGSLLVGFTNAKGKSGIEIDPAMVKASGNVHAVCADWQHLHPLLRSLGAEWPCLVVNPPFSLEWNVDGIGEGPSGEIAFPMALELLRARGAGAYIVGRDRFHKSILPKYREHIAAIVDVDDLFSDVGVKLPSTIAFFTKTKSDDEPLRLTLKHEDLKRDAADQVRRTMSYRASIYSADQEWSDTPARAKMDAAFAEYKRRLPGRLSLQKHTIELNGKRLSVKLSAYSQIKCAESNQRGILEWLGTHHHQPASRFGLQTADHKRIQKLCADPDLGISISPDACAAIDDAILEAQRDSCPLYPVEPVQRLGFLQSADELKCLVSDMARGFEAGHAYPMQCRTDVLEESGSREVITEDGPAVRSTIQTRRALSILVETTNGIVKFQESKEDIEYLLRVFDIPDPGDVATRFPKETAYWREIIGRIEKEIQAREPGFQFGWYQLEDLARLMVKHRGMLCWEMGLGKALGLLVCARALELSGRVPDGCCGFTMPQDLIPQFSAECIRFFGRELTVIDRAADMGTRKKKDTAVSAIKVRGMVAERRAYLKRVQAKHVANGARHRDLYAQSMGTSMAARPPGNDPGPFVPGVWAVTHYEALAVTGKSSDKDGLLSTWSPGYRNPDIELQKQGYSLAVRHTPITRRVWDQIAETHEYDWRTQSKKRVKEAREAFNRKDMGLSECPNCQATPVGKNDTEEREDGKVVPARGWVGRYHCRKCGYTHSALNVKAAYSILADVFKMSFVDEANKIQGDDSFQSKALRAFKSPYKIGATGTPIRQYLPSAFWPLHSIIGTGARFPYAYNGGRDAWINDFCVLEQDVYEDRTRGQKRVLAAVSNLARCWALLSRVLVRRRMDEVGIVVEMNGNWLCPDCKKTHTIDVGTGIEWSKPPYVRCCGRQWNTIAPIKYHPTVVPWGVHQKKQAAFWLNEDKFCTWFKDKYPDTPYSSEYITRMSACLGQLQRVEWAAVSPADDAEKDYWKIPVSPWTPARIKVLQLAQAAVRQGRKVLIGTERVAPGKWIAERLRELGIKAMHITEEDSHGKTKTKSPKHRAAAINSFRNGECDVLCVGENAAALGFNLDRASVVIAEGLPWVMAVWRQFLMRARRLTSKQPVDVYPIITDGSITARKWSLINRQGAAAELALDGRIAGIDVEQVDPAQILREMQEAGCAVDGTEIPEAEIFRQWEAMKAGTLPMVTLTEPTPEPMATSIVPVVRKKSVPPGRLAHARAKWKCAHNVRMDYPCTDCDATNAPQCSHGKRYDVMCIDCASHAVDEAIRNGADREMIDTLSSLLMLAMESE